MYIQNIISELIYVIVHPHHGVSYFPEKKFISFLFEVALNDCHK
jgi:hypothetical protein